MWSKTRLERMMKDYQGALNELFENATNGEDLYVKQKHIKVITECRDELQELVDKAKPMKPYIQVEDEICCPYCHEPIENNGQLVSDCCFQRMDWSK